MPVLGLLVPKSEKESVSTRVYRQAALDEGVPLEVVYYEDLLNSFRSGDVSSKALIVPDDASRFAQALLLPILQNFVKNGGKLAIIGDALTLGHNGRLKETFAVESDYGFSKTLDRIGDTIQFQNSAVFSSREWIERLRIPPGRSYIENSGDTLYHFCTYQSDDTPYPHWRTEPAKNFRGKVILEGKDGSLVAGMQNFGKGEVLWVNMPLGFLKKRTDGLFLHSFLRWISEDWVGLPTLLGVPNGQGGLVLNVHVDSNAALPGLKTMTEMGIFKQGPFSIHVTAGPDAREIGDGLGFDLAHNKTSQNWVKTWVAEGHEVGAHGGWIHDYFGKKISETETKEMVKYLELNREAVEKASGRPVLEYSSPVGNHPAWISRWLSKNGYQSYYFSGNTGMAPNRAFRDDEFTDEKLWSFPISAYRQFASFEEAKEQKVSAKVVESWLNELSDYVSNQQTVRLFYFHPPGVLSYKNALDSWMARNLKLSKQNRFRWYTMAQISTFLTLREALGWTVTEKEGRHLVLRVPGTQGIQSMVWRLSKSNVKNIKVLSGSADIRDFSAHYEIQPKDLSETLVEIEQVVP